MRICQWTVTGILAILAATTCAACSFANADGAKAEAPCAHQELNHFCIEREVTVGDETISQSISRPYVYESEDEMAKDCDSILIGTVEKQDEAYDTDEYIPDTRATVLVLTTEKGSAEPDERIIVRQTGGLPLSVLKTGKTYLFYLNDFPFEGTSTKQYYITGVTAGVFELENASSALSTRNRCTVDSFVFKRVDENSGDTLPPKLSLEEIG